MPISVIIGGTNDLMDLLLVPLILETAHRLARGAVPRIL
jgi:hypothetical protein